MKVGMTRDQIHVCPVCAAALLNDRKTIRKHKIWHRKQREIARQRFEAARDEPPRVLDQPHRPPVDVLDQSHVQTVAQYAWRTESGQVVGDTEPYCLTPTEILDRVRNSPQCPGGEPVVRTLTVVTGPWEPLTDQR